MESTTVDPRDAGITSDVVGLAWAMLNAVALSVTSISTYQTVDGEVWVRWYVASPEQKNLVLSTVQRVPGVARVVDEVAIGKYSSPPLATQPSCQLWVVQLSSLRHQALWLTARFQVCQSRTSADPQYPTAAE